MMISGDAVSISRKNGAERDRVIFKAFSSAKPVVGLHGSDLLLSVKFRPQKSRREVGNRSLTFRRITPKAMVNRRAAIIKPVVLAMVDCRFACAKAVELFILLVRRFRTPL